MPYQIVNSGSVAEEEGETEGESEETKGQVEGNAGYFYR